jgi:hypothetical protein
LSEFLQDQSCDRAFAYILRQSPLFARRLKEGLAIYLSEHSPEKLAEEAEAKYMELAEKLENIVGGMEAKSLTIPAAILLAVREADFGERFTTLNVIILISTALYSLTMIVVFISQKAILKWLKATLSKTNAKLRDKGLDDRNPILSESFVKLEERRIHSEWCSRFMVGFSFVPLVAVIYAAFFAWSSAPSSYTLKLTPTNGLQIIQAQMPQAGAAIVNTNTGGATNAPLFVNTSTRSNTNIPSTKKAQSVP